MASSSDPPCARAVMYIGELEREEEQLYQQVLKKVKTLVNRSKEKEEMLIKKEQIDVRNEENQDQDMREEFDLERNYLAEHVDEDQEMAEEPDAAKDEHQEVLDALYADLEEIVAVAKNTDEVDIQVDECHRDLLLLEKYIIDYRSTIPSGSIMVATLRASVDHLISLAQVIYGIMQDELTGELFCKNLNILHEKLGFLRKEAKVCDWHDDPESWYIYDTLEWLKKVAIRKLDKFVVKYVQKFYTVITDCSCPQHISAFCQFYKFVVLNQPDLAEKVINNYVKCKENIYTTHFKMLIDDIKNMCESKNICAPKGIFMATDTGDRDPKDMLRYFSIAIRTKPLIELTKADAVDDDSPYLECLFKNFHIRLVDVIYKEDALLKNVFLLKPKKRVIAIDRMIDKTRTPLPNSWKKYIDSIDDPVTPFLCYLLINQFEGLSKTNEIENLNKYWKSVGIVMLCRLASVIFLNTDSMTSYNVKDYNFDFCPHYAITRYSVFTAELARIQKAFPDEFIQELLIHLRKTVYEFCFRVAKSIPNTRYQLIFVINSFQDIIDITADALGNGSEEVKVFVDQMPKLAARYVHALLNTFYGDMQTYLNEVEKYVATGNHAKIAEYAPIADKIIDRFNTNWKGALEDLRVNAELAFMNPTTGGGILEVTIREYHRMLTRFTQAVSKSSKWSRENLVAVLLELEKYRKKPETQVKEPETQVKEPETQVKEVKDS